MSWIPTRLTVFSDLTTVLHKYWIIEMDQGGKNWFVGKKYKFCHVIKAAKHDSILRKELDTVESLSAGARG